jgi:hypothetical protein
MKLGNWVMLAIVLVAGYFIGVKYPHLFMRATGAA